ncbi:type II and III secretion system protein family protein [Noviherbaspirillum galbum]|nr:pilus assembly protein N-terminal domain-containing protein [Noviherbaspirillum galbum]
MIHKPFLASALPPAVGFDSMARRLVTWLCAVFLAGFGAPSSGATAIDTDTAHAQARPAQPDRRRPAIVHAGNPAPRNDAPPGKADDQPQVPEIDMFVGESRVFPTPGVARIAVGNGQILTAAALDSKETIIFANGAGSSTLFVWNEDGRHQRIKVNIMQGDITRIARDIAAFLAKIPRARASIVGDKVIVEGDKLSDADLAKIELLGKRYPQIVNFTNPLGWEQMVMMDVKVVEFPRTELRDIGLKWNAAAGGAGAGVIWSPFRSGDGVFQLNIPSPSGSALPVGTSQVQGAAGVPAPSGLNALAAVNLGLTAQLNLLARDGRATILAEPQLSTRNGSTASFVAGGEIPYTVASITGVTVAFKSYGIKLNVSPRVDSTGVIRARIGAEVSAIDPSVSSPGGPALLTRRTDAEFNVHSGETIVLSGLLQRDNSTDIDKVPLLGDLPVIGALFRSKRFQNKETELVVFVTPTLVDSHTPAMAERVDRTAERLRRDLGRPPYLSDPLQPGPDDAPGPVKKDDAASTVSDPVELMIDD